MKLRPRVVRAASWIMLGSLLCQGTPLRDDGRLGYRPQKKEPRQQALAKRRARATHGAVAYRAAKSAPRCGRGGPCAGAAVVPVPCPQPTAASTDQPLASKA